MKSIWLWMAAMSHSSEHSDLPFYSGKMSPAHTLTRYSHIIWLTCTLKSQAHTRILSARQFRWNNKHPPLNKQEIEKKETPSVATTITFNVCTIKMRISRRIVNRSSVLAKANEISQNLVEMWISTTKVYSHGWIGMLKKCKCYSLIMLSYNCCVERICMAHALCAAEIQESRRVSWFRRHSRWLLCSRWQSVFAGFCWVVWCLASIACHVAHFPPAVADSEQSNCEFRRNGWAKSPKRT